HAFVDLSRNRSRRYCDSRTCGNRLGWGGYGSSTPGLRTPAGSRADLAAVRAAAKGAGRWRSYQGRWSRPTAW
ncbi:CGNR zinc finger domain-containing protein, partial [Streptomyces sp. NPDC006356]